MRKLSTQISDNLNKEVIGRMTRTMGRWPHSPSGQLRQTTHGHKRKGKPVEAWMMDLERAQEYEEKCANNLNLNDIERIADGVEQMVFSWDLDKVERGQEYAKVFNSLTTNGSRVVLPSGLERVDRENECGLVSESTTRPRIPENIRSRKQGDTRENTRSVLYHMDSSHSISAENFNQTRDGFIPPESSLDARNPSSTIGAKLARHSKHEIKRACEPSQTVYKSCNWVTKSTRHREEKGTLVETRNSEDPGCHGVTIHQDRFSGATVLEVRRDHGGSLRISTDERRCSTERRKDERTQSGSKAMKDTTLQLTIRGQSPPRGGPSTPATPPQRNSSHFKRHSQGSPKVFYPAGNQLQLSPRRVDQPRMRNASTLTHQSSSGGSGVQRVNEITGTCGELVRRSDIRTESSKYDFAEAGPIDCYSDYRVSNCRRYSTLGQERPTETLEVGVFP